MPHPTMVNLFRSSFLAVLFAHAVLEGALRAKVLEEAPSTTAHPMAGTRAPKVEGPVATTAQRKDEEQGKDEKKPDVIFVPTPQAVVDKMLELAEVKAGDLLYDLGFGDGRIVVTAAKRYGIKTTGFDIDP